MRCKIKSCSIVQDAVQMDLPQEASPFVSADCSVPVDGGVLGEGLAANGRGDGFVVDLVRPNASAGCGCVCTKALGTNVFDGTAKLDAVESGKGSGLNTSSKRARLNSARSTKPR
jgi:hypothetical protein